MDIGHVNLNRSFRPKTVVVLVVVVVIVIVVV